MSVLEWNSNSCELPTLPELSILPRKPEFVIREATPLDANVMAKMRIQLLLESEQIKADDDNIALLQSSEAYFANAIEKENYFGWMVELEGKMVGMGGVNVFMRTPYPGNSQGKEFYLLNLYTTPEYREMGVASSLTTKAIELAKAHYVPKIWLDSSEEGRGVFENSGFTENSSAMELLVI